MPQPLCKGGLPTGFGPRPHILRQGTLLERWANTYVAVRTGQMRDRSALSRDCADHDRALTVSLRVRSALYTVLVDTCDMKASSPSKQTTKPARQQTSENVFGSRNESGHLTPDARGLARATPGSCPCPSLNNSARKRDSYNARSTARKCAPSVSNFTLTEVAARNDRDVSTNVRMFCAGAQLGGAFPLWRASRPGLQRGREEGEGGARRNVPGFLVLSGALRWSKKWIDPGRQLITWCLS